MAVSQICGGPPTSNNRSRLQSLCLYVADPDPPDEPEQGPKALLRAQPPLCHLCPLLRRELKRHPQEVQEHGGQDVRMSLNNSASYYCNNSLIKRNAFINVKKASIFLEDQFAQMGHK